MVELMNTELNVAINVPKALGKSVKTSINKSSSILEVIKNNVEKSIVDKIIHDNEFNRFALIYQKMHMIFADYPFEYVDFKHLTCLPD